MGKSNSSVENLRTPKSGSYWKLKTPHPAAAERSGSTGGGHARLRSTLVVAEMWNWFEDKLLRA